MITIQNNRLKATLNELGAELISLINLENEDEIMEGNPDFGVVKVLFFFQQLAL
jgi:hypothetical protein